MMDLDSVDEDDIAPEEELPGEEEQSILVRPVMSFDDLDLTVISDLVLVEQTQALALEAPGFYDQV
jgi:hypothetical protein